MSLRKSPTYRRRRRLAALCATALAATLLSASAAHAATTEGEWEPGPAMYDTVPVTDVKITMDDGVTLVGDVMYPAKKGSLDRADGHFPVLLAQNPYYCQTSASNLGATAVVSDWKYFVQRGYILTSICVRGAGRSGGIWDIWSPRSAKDGAQLVDWAAHRLDGSNGVVGLIGCSYLGAMQSITAAALAPGSPVKAMAPYCTGGEAYRVTFFSGGVPTQTFTWLLARARGVSAETENAKLAAEIASGGERAYDREYWEARTPVRGAEQIVRNGIPALFWTGYDDTVVMTGTMEFVAALQNAYFGRDPRAMMRPGQPVTGRYQIVVGPWGHGGGIDLSLQLKWYDTWLKHKPTGMADTKTPLHMWSLGKETWVNTATYPMVRRYTSYYLDPGGRLSLEPPAGVGTASRLEYAQPDTPGARATFRSGPLLSGVTLAGPVSASVWVSSTGANAQIIASLYDVAPDGTAKRLTRGSFVASLRKLDRDWSWADDRGTPVRPYGSFDRDQYLTPGDPVRVDIALDPRMAEIAPGHSLRVDLTTQASTADCAAGLGSDPCYPTLPQQATLPGTYTIHRGGDMPSAIHLPLAPLGAYPSAGDGPVPTVW